MSKVKLCEDENGVWQANKNDPLNHVFKQAILKQREQAIENAWNEIAEEFSAYGIAITYELADNIRAMIANDIPEFNYGSVEYLIKLLVKTHNEN